MAKLFFELASESRLSILNVVDNEALKLQEVARRLDVTDTEALRQLERLSAASLVARQPDGTYRITQYGKLLLHVSETMNFLLKHKQYFASHDFSALPYQFIDRLGELSGATFIADTMESLNRGQRVFIAMEEWGWGMAEGVVPELMGPVMEQKAAKGIKMKFIIPEDKLPKTPSEAPDIEARGLPSVPAVIAITEKEALIALRLNDGKMDYATFSGTDPKFVGWVKDLFTYFWERGKRV